MIDSPGAIPERAPRIFDVITVMFVAFLLTSNIAATKVTTLDAGPTYFVFDGGATLFPLTYVLGGVFSEVYGLARAERVIIPGLIISVPASLIFPLVQVTPAGPGHENQAAFEAVPGFIPRVVAAPVVDYLVG